MGSLFNFRLPSLLRANLLTLTCLAVAFAVARFPANHATPCILLPLLGACVGMSETFRCIRGVQWSLYRATALISLYMNVMSLIMILFLALYPLLTRVG